MLISLLLPFTLAFSQYLYAAGEFATRPRPVITTENCESYLLSRKGVRMTQAVRKWFAGLSETVLEVEHLPVFSFDTANLRQPYEFFLEENQDRSFEELYSEYYQRQMAATTKLLEEFKLVQPLTPEIAKSAIAAHSTEKQSQELSPLEKIALGLSNVNHFTLGDLKEVRISGNKQGIVLVTIDQGGVPRGRVEIPIENIRLGFQNTVASWQASRYMENPEGFFLIGEGDQAVRRFLLDQGRILIDRRINGIRLGYLFEYNQATSKPGRPSYIHVRVVTLRDCDRPSVERHEILFPEKGLASQHMNLCAAPTELHLHTH